MFLLIVLASSRDSEAWRYRAVLDGPQAHIHVAATSTAVTVFISSHPFRNMTLIPRVARLNLHRTSAMARASLSLPEILSTLSSSILIRTQELGNISGHRQSTQMLREWAGSGAIPDP